MFRSFSSSTSNEYRQIHGTAILDLDINDYVGVFLVAGSMFGLEELRSFCGYLIG
jgi:hypothetical protein